MRAGDIQSEVAAHSFGTVDGSVRDGLCMTAPLSSTTPSRVVMASKATMSEQSAAEGRGLVRVNDQFHLFGSPMPMASSCRGMPTALA